MEDLESVQSSVLSLRPSQGRVVEYWKQDLCPAREGQPGGDRVRVVLETWQGVGVCVVGPWRVIAGSRFTGVPGCR